MCSGLLNWSMQITDLKCLSDLHPQKVCAELYITVFFFPLGKRKVYGISKVPKYF